MRIISLKIENFGNLSDYSLTFDRDLTVICEDNGFGKTTLAEFIKTMFYGFPRAGRTLEKNSRKKNDPWQGGTFGGNLVFEHEGTRYRIERTFGSVPRHDTFALYDLDKNKKSNRFSEDIGLELFELDADSFERSTYLPQMQTISSFSTSSIQAKLSDLVEDTNDIINYDKALQALKNKRSSYIPFRGSSGSVAEADRRLTKLHHQLEQAENMFPELDALQQEIDQLEDRKEKLQSSLETTRQEITLSAEAASRKALKSQHQALQNRVRKIAGEQSVIQDAYPNGMPSELDVDQLLAVYDKVAQVGPEPIKSEAEQREETFVSDNASRFAGGIPSEEDFDYYQQRLNRRISCVSSLEHADLSTNEKKKLQELEAFFSDGIPKEGIIDEWEEKENELKTLNSQLKDLQLPSDEATKLRHLEIFFAPGLPDEAALSEKQRELARAEELRLENLTIAIDEESLMQQHPPKQEKRVLLVMLIVLGLCALGAGIVFFVQQSFLFGGGFLALGIVLLLAAVYNRLRQMISGGSPSAAHSVISREEREAIQQNEREAAALEKSVLYYVAPYISDDRSLSSKLSEIETKYSQYQLLKRREEQLTDQRQSMQERVAILSAQLQEVLAPYRPNKDLPFRDLLARIRTGRSQLLELTRKLQDYVETAKRTRIEIDSIDDEMNAFFRAFETSVQQKDYGSQLLQLQKEASFYVRAEENIEERRSQKERRRQIISECRERIKVFSETFSLALALEDKETALRIRDDVKEAKMLAKNAQEAKRDLEQFSVKHKEELATPISDIDVRDLGELKEIEKRSVSELTRVAEALTHRHQRLRVIQEQTDKIPALQDDLTEWTERRKDDIKRADLLDWAIHFLQQAKDSLSKSYLGTIKQSFTKYMKRLLGEEEESIFVNQELDVQMERGGVARELAYFSVGQTDIVMLCMRFALVDALFGDKKPFVILDDPFINLDDDNTEKALSLIKDFSEEYQIIYMTCNSSRELVVS
ncbi:MAG TPA: AAA family ATPase [Clostridiaceae bacterium]|nr:AAA family ATPase [Clostridiaceae bacterium]